MHEFQIELEDKEQLLEEREQQVYLREEEVMQKEQELLLTQASFQRAKNVMSRLQGVEIEVEEKFRLLREVCVFKNKMFPTMLRYRFTSISLICFG